MPHCIIEHSNDLTDEITPVEMMEAAHRAMQASDLFETSDIKVRTKEYEYFQSNGVRQHFIHVTLKVLNGRSTHQKQNLSALVIKSIDELPVLGVEITVDVQDMETESYMKIKN